MEKWIEILRAGKYPQGNVTSEDLAQMAKSYDPQYQQAPFIPEHRKFDDEGQLINNMSALAWIKAVRINNDALEVLVEDEEFLKMYYDGKSYRYASAEIETHTINNAKIKYLGAVAITNFPASKIKQIKLSDEKLLSVYTIKIKKEDSVMNKEQFIQLCKALGIAEDSTPEVAIQKLTDMQTTLKGKGNDDLKAIADQLTAVIKLVKVEESPAGKDNEAVTKLTETVNSLLTRFDLNDESAALQVFEKAVTDKKLLPNQKDDLVGTKEKPGTFFKNANGLQQFVDKLPVMRLNSEVVIPKDQNDKPITYKQLLKDPVAYQKMQKENPELLSALREKRFEEPAVEVKK